MIWNLPSTFFLVVELDWLGLNALTSMRLTMLLFVVAVLIPTGLSSYILMIGRFLVPVKILLNALLAISRIGIIL